MRVAVVQSFSFISSLGFLTSLQRTPASSPPSHSVMRFTFATFSAIALSSTALALPVQHPAAHTTPSHGHLSSRQAEFGPRDIDAFPVKRVSADNEYVVLHAFF